MFYLDRHQFATWFKHRIDHNALIVFSVVLFAASVLLMLLRIRVPDYGGDELWFAAPLLNRDLLELNIFQFEYAGPAKTILTTPIFHIFGFSIYTVRLFTIGVFVIGAVAWSLYLAKKSYWIAFSATLLAIALNHDLLFFAKVDINQPTFYNTIIIFVFISFIVILESGTNWKRATVFLILAFISINNHIRNIWIINAFLMAVLIDSILLWRQSTPRLSHIRVVFNEKWPIFVGWLISVLYSLNLLYRFAGSPLFERAKALGDGITWLERIEVSARNFALYSVGGLVFNDVYAGEEWKSLTITLGVIFLVSSALLFGIVVTRKGKDPWLRRLLLITFLLVLLIFLQYSLTKSAKWAWHGNSLLLFLTIFFGLLVQSLYSVGKRWLLTVYLLSTIIAMSSINVAASMQISHSEKLLQGFQLAHWNLQALDDIREYISKNPGDYYIADWGIGRPLALESKYRPISDTQVNFIQGSLANIPASIFNDALVIRSTEIALTVPDFTDDALADLDNTLRFVVLKSFFDNYGREVYQLGYIENVSGTNDIVTESAITPPIIVQSVTAGTCQEDPANILNNPGFEDGSSDWNFYSGDEAGTLTISEPAYQCAAAAQLEFVKATASTLLRQTGFTLLPQKKYLLSFVAKSSSGNDLTVYLEKSDFSTNYGISYRIDLTSSWQKYTIPVTAGSDVASPQLRFGFGGNAKADDVYFIDDVYILPTDD